MKPRPSSPRPGAPISARLRRWLRWAWLDLLPVSGWVAAWRAERRRKQAAGRRPQLSRLRPEFDPFEERAFLGLDMVSALQVALVGSGVALLAEMFRQSANGAAVPAPATPGNSPQAAEAPRGDDVPFPAIAGGGGAAADGPWGSQGVTGADAPDEVVTHLTPADTAGLGGSLGSLDSDPGLGDSSSASDSGHGGGGGGVVAPPANNSAGGPGPAGGASGGASGGGSSGPAIAPAGGMSSDPGLFTPPTSPAARSTTASAVVAHATGASAAAATALPGATTGGTSAAAAKPSFAGIAQNYGHLPVYFEPNLGQADPRVQFLSHGPGFSFFVTADGAATLSLPRPGAATTRDVLRLSLAGANPAPRLVPEGQQAGYSNYFSGGADGKSVTDVPQYGRLVEQGVYPGIDLVWHSAAGRTLEYDFVVSPGADPSAIRLHVEGATGLSTDAKGDLLIRTGGGTLVQRAPALSQPGPGGTTQAVAGSAVLLPGGDVGFRVGAYDPARALTIDPVIQSSSYLGGSGDDKAYAVAAQGDGSLYVAGTTSSTDFPTTTGAYQSTNPGQSLFITKLNAAGSAYLYSSYLSGVSSLPGNSVTLYGLAVDPAGSAYAVGSTTGTDFPTTSGAYQPVMVGSGSTNAFLTRLSATGDALLYSTYFGIAGTTGNAIAVDPQGDAYITGSTPVTDGSGNTFPTTAGAFQTTAGAGSHAFVSVLDPTGGTLVYSTLLAGSGTDSGLGVAVDQGGDAFVTGTTASSDFPTTAGAFQTSPAGSGASSFVTEVLPSGSALGYSTYLGGASAAAIAVDPAGQAFVTGSTDPVSALNFPTTAGAVQTSSGGSTDGFVTALTAAGDGLLYSTFLGGGGSDSAAAIAVDAADNAVVTGSTASDGMFGPAFPTTAGALQSGYGGSTDSFVTQLAPDGTSLSYSSYLGGSGTDTGTAASVDVFGNAYVVGYTNSTNFPTVSPSQGTKAGGYDAWVVKLSPKPAPPAITGVTGGVSTSSGVVTASQNLTISGTSTASATVTVSRADRGVLGTTTADGSGNWSYNYTGTTLAEGSYAFSATQAVGGVAGDPAGLLVAVDRTAPAVALAVPSGAGSLAPVVRVTASDLNGLPDGTAVAIDVDKNNDGDFADAGETGYGSGTLSGGAAEVVLPALPSPGTYPTRARVSDRVGNAGASPVEPMGVTTITLGGGWTGSAQALTIDPLTGDALDQLGDVKASAPLDLDQGGGGMSAPLASCGCAAYKGALDYNSDSVAQQPVIQATLNSPNDTSLPANISGVLTWNGTAGATLTWSTSGLSPGDLIVVAAQVPTAVTATGSYTWQLQVLSPVSLTFSGTTYVVAQDASPLGAGWSFATADRLYVIGTSGVLRAYGTGEWRFYTGSGSSFSSPAGDNGTMSLSGGVYTYTTPDGQAWTFGATVGTTVYETGWASADGQSRLTYTYDGSGNLTGMTAIDGTTTTLTYSGGKPSKVVTGNNRTTSLAYDASGNLTKVTNPDGGLHTFAYDASHRVTGETFANLRNGWAYGAGRGAATMTWGSGTGASATKVVPVDAQGLPSQAVRGPVYAQQTDADNNLTQAQLDGQARPQVQVAGDGGVTTLSWSASEYLTAVADPLGRTTTYARDAAGYVTVQTNPDGSTVTFQYQASYPSGFHALTTLTDERGQTTTYAYDAQGRLTSMTAPLGRRTDWTYLGSGLVQSVADPRGNLTTYAYDALRRLTTATDALNGVTTTGYDANGFAQARTDPRGFTTTTLYDVMGRVTATVDPAGGRTTTTYNAAGLVLTQRDELNRQTSYLYDSFNRGLVTKVTRAVGTPAAAPDQSFYGPAGRLTRTVDPIGAVTTYLYDGAGRQTEARDMLGGVTKTFYDKAGEVTATQDPRGNVTGFQYNPRGWVTQTTDPFPAVTTTLYDAAGHPTMTYDGLSNPTTMAYDAAGRATLTTDARGGLTTTTYDAADNVSTVTDPTGSVTSYGYDALNRVTAVTEAVGTAAQRTTQAAYDAAGNVTATVDGRGDRTTYSYDPAGRRTQVQDALNGLTTTQYDARRNATRVVDALGRVTTTLYDAQDRPTQVQDALTHRTTTGYDAAGNVVSRTDALAHVTQWVPDKLGRVVAAVDALGHTTTYSYDQAGNRTAAVDANKNKTQWFYDGLNRVTQAQDALSNLTTMVYDAAGNLSVTVDARGDRTTFSYDALNRPTQVQDALGNLTTTVYDAAGDVSATVDARGDRTTFGYDALHRQTQAQDALLNLTTTVYDAADNVSATVDARGNRTTFSYDALNRRTQAQDALNNLTTTVFDAVGNVSATVDARGDRTTYTYDLANRLTQVQDALLNLTTTVFDAADRVSARVDARGDRTTYTYDQADRLTQVKDALGKLTTAVYDLANNRVATVDALGHRTTYSYDALNRVTQVKDALLNLTTTVFDAAGNVSATVDGRGDRTTYSYDALNRATQVQDALLNLTTTVFDAAGNTAATVDARGNRTTFSYDALNRQTQAQDALGDLMTTVYDAAGNVSATVDARGDRTTYSYDALNRATQAQDALSNLTTTVYDAAGNVSATVDARGNRTTYSYDARNRATQATDALNNLTTIVYDAAGNVSATVDARGDRTTYTYDPLNRRTQVKDALSNFTTTVYDAAGNVSATVDGRGDRTTYSYDAANRQTQVKDALGNLMTTVYDAASNVSARVDGLGHRTTFSYDALNRVTQVKDALLNLTTTVYDAAGNVSATVDARDNRTTFSYDALNRRTQAQDALTNLTTTVYDAAGNVSARVDALGHRTTYGYDALNRATQTTDALNDLTTTVYDAAGNVSVTIDGLGRRTTYSYDALNRATQTADPLNNLSTTVYEAAGNVLAAVTARGFRTTYSYDALNRRTQAQDALLNLTTVVYDAAGNVSATVDGRGDRTTYSYDADNRQTTRTDPLGHKVTTVYDAAGNVARMIDAGNFTTTYGYDADNRRTQLKDAAGGLTTTAYDPAGNTTAVTDPLAHTTTTAYDALNRASQVTDARGYLTTTLYDPDGNQTGVLDADGNRTTFAYDALNRLTQQTDPLNNASTLAYDAAGQKTSATDRLGRRTTFAYDAAGREAGETWFNVGGSTQQVVSFAYDADGNPTLAANLSGAYTYAYDALDRVAAAQGPFGLALTYLYDQAGNRTQTQDSQGGTTTYVYDAANRLTSVQFAGTAPMRTDFTYTTRDQVQTEARYSDLGGTTKVGSTSYAYDQVGRVTNVQHYNGAGSSLANYTYGYDLASRLTQQKDNGGAPVTYTYDAANQLLGDGTTTYTYDATGNRTNAGYVTPSDNQVTGDGTWTYTYDAEGNETGKTNGSVTWAYTYDDANRLLTAQETGAATEAVTYTYDVFDHLLTESATGGVAVSLHLGYDGNNVWADLNGSNVLQTRRLFDNANITPLARESAGGTVAWYDADHQGSVRLVTDNTSGAALDALTYSGFGVLTSESSPSSGDRYKYAGGQADGATGLVLYYHRYLDPVTLRWMTQDPIGFVGGDTNLYRYAANAPTDQTDPSGEILYAAEGRLKDSLLGWFKGAKGTEVGTELGDPLFSPLRTVSAQRAAEAWRFGYTDQREVRLALRELDPDWWALGKDAAWPSEHRARQVQVLRALEDLKGNEHNLDLAWRAGDDGPIDFEGEGGTKLFLSAGLKETEARVQRALAAFHGHFDPHNIPESIVNRLVADHLAIRIDNYVYVTDVGANDSGSPRAYQMLLQQEAEYEPGRCDSRIRLDTSHYSVAYYKLNENNLTDPTRLMGRMRTEGEARALLDEYKKKGRDAAIEAVSNFALHLIPGYSAYESYSKGDYIEGTIALAGDILMVASFGLGGLAKAGITGVRLAKAAQLLGRANIALNGTVFLYRIYQGGIALYNGESAQAAGYLGDATLRLLGMAPDLLAEIKALRSAKAPMGPCFPAETLVATEHGLRPIQAVRRSDRVWGYDLASGEWKLRPVVKTYEHNYEGDLIALAVEGEVIEATSNHPFWLVEGEGLDQRERPDHTPAILANTGMSGCWMAAGNLRLGDVLLLRSSQTATISSLAVRHVRQKVYNFEVERLHTYTVGKCQVLVHNKSATSSFPPANPGGMGVWGKVKVPKAEPAAGLTPAQIARQLPTWKQGDPAHGALVVDGSVYYIKSSGPGGNANYASALAPRELIGELGFTAENIGHVEGSAAALLRRLELQGADVSNAYLVVNRPFVCTQGGLGCKPNLNKMLPPGSKLRVYPSDNLGAGGILFPWEPFEGK